MRNCLHRESSCSLAGHLLLVVQGSKRGLSVEEGELVVKARHATEQGARKLSFLSFPSFAISLPLVLWRRPLPRMGAKNGLRKVFAPFLSSWQELLKLKGRRISLVSIDLSLGTVLTFENLSNLLLSIHGVNFETQMLFALKENSVHTH